MTEASHPSATNPPSGESLPVFIGKLNTTACSVVHYFFEGLMDRARHGHILAFAQLYGILLIITLVPLEVVACLSHSPLTFSACEPGRPFCYDWNVWFMFLVSFPCLVILTVNDHYVLTSALKTIQRDGTITISGTHTTLCATYWSKRFRDINLFGQIFGFLVGLGVACLNYCIFSDSPVKIWYLHLRQFLPVGYVYLVEILLFYALIVIYVIRVINISLLLRDIAENTQLHLLPLHPDKCGGLRPIGRVGLRNQYVLTILGFNLALFVMIYRAYLGEMPNLNFMMLLAVFVYMTVGPLVFMAPLLPFRSGMLKNKAQLMAGVIQSLRRESDRRQTQLQSGPISKEDEELIERLHKVGGGINELPVWPFDVGTLRKFITAYAIPLGSFIAQYIFNLAKGLTP